MSVRGYAAWNPKPDALGWVVKTRRVLDEYKDEWPLTVRQVFYRLVAVYGYPKTEAAYTRLTQTLGRARRAGMIRWDAIRDGGAGYGVAASFFDGADDFERSVRSAAENLSLDRQRGQEQVIELWCEAGGMVPILQRVGGVYSARVNTGGGYDSVTAKHRLAQRVRDRAEVGLRTLVLHVGDFDGSGEDMCSVLREDAGAMAATLALQSLVRTSRASHDDDDARNWEHAPSWVWEEMRERPIPDRFVDYIYEWFDVERVALTAEQVVERNVITAPPKPSDSRTRGFIERNAEVVAALGTENISAQLEALTPPELRELLATVIEDHIDMDVYRDVRAEEEKVRRDLLKRLDAR